MLPVVVILLAALVLIGAVACAFAWIGAFFARRNRASVRLWATVAGILGFGLSLTFGVIVAALGLPIFLRARKEANETSAVAGVRRIHQAEIQYNVTYPQFGFTCSLSDLGGAAGSPQGPKNSQFLLDEKLETGQKGGYVFRLVNCTQARVDGRDRRISYQITAVPIALHKTGDNGFCGDMSGVVTIDPKGGTNCTVVVH